MRKVSAVGAVTPSETHSVITHVEVVPLKYATAALLLLTLTACSGGNVGGDGAADSGNADGTLDGGSTDGNSDSGSTDGSSDSGSTDGTSDGGSTDGTSDSGSTDGTTDSGNTDGTSDGGSADGTTDGTTDGGSTDGGSSGNQVSNLQAVHRSGQTFITWREPDSSSEYHVYRHNQPITSGNLSSATLLTSRWGPIDADSSVHKHRALDVPEFFVISDLGSPLGNDTGLFVHTTQSGAAGNAYYAVTTVANGNENRTIVSGVNALNSPRNESVSTTRPVLTVSVNGGKGRIYTQYMDYSQWNPTFNGYAFNYAVALPSTYNPSVSYPLQIQLHAFGAPAKSPSQSEWEWPVIQLFPTDPGSAHGTVHTWWYGHAADHNYKTSGSIPGSGAVANFTEQRLVKAINEVIADSSFNVNTDLIHAYGNSMGASGSLTLALRYPGIFAGIYASQPMTNYGQNPGFQNNLIQLWGNQSSNLQIINGGDNIDAIADYGIGGSQPTSVWDWMDHQQQLRRRRGEEFAYLILDFGKADATLEWQSQGQPMFSALTDAKAAFSARALGGFGHGSMGFGAVDTSLFGFGYDDEAAWRYPNSLSFPALHRASGSGSINPGTSGDDLYNQNIDWSTSRNAFHQPIVDTGNRWEVTLRSMAGDQTVDVTPRNTQSFRPFSGQQCSWTARRVSDNQQTGGGNITADGDALLTVAQMSVSTAGTRLTINCP